MATAIKPLPTSSLVNNFVFPPERRKAPVRPVGNPALENQRRLETEMPDYSGRTPTASLVGNVPVDPLFIQDVQALGTLLFRCPPLVEEQVCIWLGRIQNEFIDRPIDNITMLLQFILGTSPHLRFDIRPVVNFLSEPHKRICIISFLRDTTQDKNNENYYGCDDELLIEALNRDVRSAEEPDVGLSGSQQCHVNMARFAIIVSSLVLHNERGGFLQRQNSTGGGQRAILSSFESNNELHRVFRKAPFIVAILRYVLRYCEALLSPQKEQTPEEMDITYETASQLIEACHLFVSELSHRHSSLSSHSSQLTEELLIYDPDDKNNENLFFGVPSEIACSDKDSDILLWLQHTWMGMDAPVPRDEEIAKADKTEINYDDDAEEKEEEAAADAQPSHNRNRGYRRLLDNLWCALSVSMTADYIDYFETWDSEHLVPILKYDESTMSQFKK